MACVLNSRLMVPVSSGNYKFRESVSLTKASRVHPSRFSTLGNSRCNRSADGAIIRATFTFVIKARDERRAYAQLTIEISLLLCFLYGVDFKDK